MSLSSVVLTVSPEAAYHLSPLVSWVLIIALGLSVRKVAKEVNKRWSVDDSPRTLENESLLPRKG